MTYSFLVRPARLAIVFLTALSLAAQAQTAAPAPSTPAGETEESGDEPLVLSPFVVSTDKDVGYAANDTLAGSRMRTSLSDVPNAISVFTTEFMNDVLATGENDLLRYSASAIPERSEQTPNVQGIDNFAGQFQARIRGQKATRSRNYFETNLLPDTYNIERFEEARGPNSILFGLGGAGGLLNATTKQAILSRDATEVNVLIGSWKQRRGTLDHNQKLTKQLAFRLNGVIETADGWHPFDVKDNRRIAGALTYRPFEKVTVRLEGEMGEMTDSVTRSYTASDFVSIWAKNGRILLPSAIQAPTAAQIAAGIGRRNADARITFIGNDDTVKNFQQTLFSNHTVATGRNRSALLPEDWAAIDSSPYPYEASFFGRGGYVDQTQEAYSASIEVEPIKNLFIEAAFNHDERTHHFYDSNDNVMQIRGEPARTYRDGTANPYAGRYYLETFPVLRYSTVEADRWRVTAAYTLDLGKVGRHNLAVSRSADDSSNPRRTSFLSVLGSPFNATPTAVQNRLWVRHYITDPANPASWLVPDWRNVPKQVSVALSAGQTPTTYDVGWADEATNLVIANTDSSMATIQSYWLKERVISTVGYRKVNYTQSRGASLDEGSLSTRSYGVVAKPINWVSLYYNYSENAVVPTATQTLLPDNALFPLNRGEGQDYGLMFSLFDKRVFVRAGYFKTSSLDQANATALGPNVRQPHERITAALVTAGLIQQSAVPVFLGGDFDLSDVDADGYELNITANFTDNWRLIFNATKANSESSNLLKVARELIDDNLALWQTAGGQSLVTSNGITVADEIANIMVWRNSTLVLEGDSTIGHRPEQARLFTRYDLQSGAVKGLFFGGGLSYSGEATIGKVTATNTLIKSPAIWEAEALLGYRVKLGKFLGKNVQLTLQLNAQNLLQDERIALLRADTDGQIYRGVVNPPRRYLLNARLQF